MTMAIYITVMIKIMIYKKRFMVVEINNTKSSINKFAIAVS